MKAMKPEITVDIEHHIEHPDCPSDEQIIEWVKLALSQQKQDTEISIILIDDQEMSELNETYRHKKGPTNVLSFPFEKPEGLELSLLGDLAICVPQMLREAQEQHKPVYAHFAHLTIHGCLHLLGYDHIDTKSAEEMEQLEINLLKQINIPNPYQERTL
ncbi:MAG: rRNA maturation RNase YbeY [Legionellales bacterium]|jgi:probable rRNA maturation factor